MDFQFVIEKTQNDLMFGIFFKFHKLWSEIFIYYCWFNIENKTGMDSVFNKTKKI